MNNLRGHIPIRTCVSCRTRMAKKELIRLSLDEKARIVVDIDGKMKGRGFYICHRESCVRKLYENRNLNRLFRVNEPVSIGFQI